MIVEGQVSLVVEVLEVVTNSEVFRVEVFREVWAGLVKAGDTISSERR